MDSSNQPAILRILVLLILKVADGTAGLLLEFLSIG
jgi:hypothetical protein